MGIVNEYMVKNAIGLGDNVTLELEADPGQSYMVKDIMVGKNDTEFLDITIDKAMVGRFRTGKLLGSHLSFPYGMTQEAHDTNRIVMKPRRTILGYLAERDIFKGFPIAEGQKMTLSPTGTDKELGDVTIVYEEYEGGDIGSDLPNGSDSTEYMIINYGDVGSAITAAGEYIIDTYNSPNEFPAFPIDKDVPAKTEIDLIGILATESYDYDAANEYTYTTYLKLVKERTVLFDEDRNGLLMRGWFSAGTVVNNSYGEGNSVLGNYSTVDMKKPYLLPEPITFGPGEELNVYVIAAEGSTGPASIAQAGSEVGFILNLRRVS